MNIDIIFTVFLDVFIIFLLANVFFSGRKWLIDYKQHCKMIDFYCELHRKLNLWLEKNQGVYIGLSPEGRELVLRCFEAYEKMIKECCIAKNENTINYFESLLNNFPGPEDNENFPIKITAPVGAVLLATIFRYVCN